MFELDSHQRYKFNYKFEVHIFLKRNIQKLHDFVIEDYKPLRFSSRWAKNSQMKIKEKILLLKQI